MLTDQWYCVPMSWRNRRLKRLRTATFSRTEAVRKHVLLLDARYSGLGISRQLWWGHRIPAWYDEAGTFMLAATKTKCVKKITSVLICPASGRRRSRYLVLFCAVDLSTLGWPENTDALRQFHPTS